MVQASTMDQARDLAARSLGVLPETVLLEVQGVKRAGFLGMGTPQLLVRATVLVDAEQTVSEPTAEAQLPERVARPEAPVAVPEPVEAPAAPPPPREPAPRPNWVVWCEAGDCMFRTNTRDVTLDNVEEAIRGWPFDEYFGDGLRAALQQVNDANVMIGRIAAPPDMTNETKFFLKIPTDGMTAWVVPGHHPYDDSLSAQELTFALKQKGVQFGIDKRAIEALEGRHLTRPVLIAKGFDGSPSRDSAVEFLFPEEDPDVVLRPMIREDGTVDYRDLIRLHTVPSGTILGRYLPATAGEPRKDVFGRETPNKMGTEIPPQRFAGPNVELAANGIDYIAKKSGRPLREKGRIEVMEVYAIQGDVDFSTGNVDFKGEVFVGGDVKPGFTVRATGSIQVGGLVDEAIIYAGKDILIQGGVSGHGQCLITCGGDLSARFIDSADVEAERNVVVASQIVRSNIVSKGQVTVMGRGSIVGSKVTAARGITCMSAGSPSGVATSLELDWLAIAKPGEDSSRYQSATIVIRGDAHAGTMVTINGAKFPIRESMKGVQFAGADKGISLVQLS